MSANRPLPYPRERLTDPSTLGSEALGGGTSVPIIVNVKIGSKLISLMAKRPLRGELSHQSPVCPPFPLAANSPKYVKSMCPSLKR